VGERARVTFPVFLFEMPEKTFKAEILFGGKVEPSVKESFEKFHEQLIFGPASQSAMVNYYPGDDVADYS
jgi:hypothetical protein